MGYDGGLMVGIMVKRMDEVLVWVLIGLMKKTMVVVVFDPLKRQANLEDIVIQPFKMDD